MLGTRGGCSGPLGQDPRGTLAHHTDGRSLTCTLAARQVHQLQPGAHLLRGLGPRGPG